MFWAKLTQDAPQRFKNIQERDTQGRPRQEVAQHTNYSEYINE
jgi:hypothetical protein